MSFILIKEQNKQNVLPVIDEAKYVEFNVFDIDANTTLYIDDLKSNISRNRNKKCYTIGFSFFENDELLREFGAYCAIDCTAEDISIYTDLMGYYPVFYLNTPGQVIISDRFELIKKVYKGNLTLNTDSCNEYIFGELVYGADTFYSEIKRLCTLERIVINKGELKVIKETYDLNRLLSIEALLSHYNRYISLIEKKYGSYIIKLSGGYDSRLALTLFLAYAKKNMPALTLNIDPHDVATAKEIAKTFNLDLNILDEIKDEIVYSQGNFNIKDEDKKIEVVISGQCGELNRGYYYPKTKAQLNKLAATSDYYMAIVPLHKRMFMNKLQLKLFKNNTNREVERIKKEFDQNEVFRIMDYIYLNRTRNYFALRMADPMNKNLPVLVDPHYFRFRLNYQYDEIANGRVYEDIFKATNPRLLMFPFKGKQKWYHTDTFLKFRRVLPILFASKAVNKDLAVGLSAKNDKLFNSHGSTWDNYKTIRKIINS